MLTKIIYINPGNNIVNNCINGIKNVTFVTNENNWQLEISKCDFRCDFITDFSQIATSNDKFNYYGFESFRDGMTRLKISSNCTGVLTIYYDGNYYKPVNPLVEAIDNMKKVKRLKYYNKFLRHLYENKIIPYNEKNIHNEKYKLFLNFKLTKDFKLLPEDTLYIFPAKYIFDDILGKKHIRFPHLSGDIFTHLLIESEMDTEISIKFCYDKLLNINITKCMKSYPLLFPSSFAVYHDVTLICNDACLKSIEFITIPAPPEWERPLRFSEVTICEINEKKYIECYNGMCKLIN
jgi:hypothetical protein